MAKQPDKNTVVWGNAQFVNPVTTMTPLTEKNFIDFIRRYQPPEWIYQLEPCTYGKTQGQLFEAPQPPIERENTMSRASMTKQHFEAIAAAVKTIRGANLRMKVADTLAPVMKQFNNSFDARRFKEACGVQVHQPGQLYYDPIAHEWKTG